MFNFLYCLRPQLRPKLLINGACDLLTSSKGKLKWEGNLASLRRLFDEVLDSSMEWTLPGGDSKKCECEGLILRWYPTSGSLTLNGDNADKVKAQLLQLMEAGYENVDDLSQDGGRVACDVEEEAFMQIAEECGMDMNTNDQIDIDLHGGTTQVSQLGVIQKHIENIENKMERSFASFDKDLRELRVIIELSMEIRASQSLSENVRLSILVGHKSPVNKTPDDNEIEVVNVAEKQISKAAQVERINQSYVAKATKALNDPKNRKIDGSEQSSKDGRKAQSYKQSYNDQVTKVNHGSNQNRNSPNDTPILLIGDSIIKNIDPRKISRRRTVKICLPGKKAEQITAEVKSISVTNPSHVIIHAGTNNLPTDSEHECAKHAEDLVKCIKARFPVAKIALSGITIRRDIDVPAKLLKSTKSSKNYVRNLAFIL